MTKAYSNKALPSGTILREWRLEEVLGVGGFGIVYKGRGIYFDELVAIKEYFPSAISERDQESTVVPIDSDAEEVHALGLKKFVEEAKLLWNLSTPSRHPNIVSVRSLFEIHGTAYMVMDFEDGVSLTDVLNRGEKFDEEKLRQMVLPVASGLERAHRVGVLHRDIKPSNILITDSGQPVLIDFGSARFEAEGVTSTTVTFHTPPYAAIEQYVKTYEQGPWTDIYALGVVLYRCITGEKPAEVLERLHGGMEPPLVDGNWPGYSREFLAAVDAAMIIKPSERPQSLPEWLNMFNQPATATPKIVDNSDDDDEATRLAPMAASIDEIRPVGVGSRKPASAVDAGQGKESAAAAKPEPARPETSTSSGDAGKSKATAAQTEKDKASPVSQGANATGDTAKTADKDPKAKVGAKAGAGTLAAKPKGKGMSKPMLLAGAVGVALIAGLAWTLGQGGGTKPAPDNANAGVENVAQSGEFGPALQGLVELAREKNLGAKLVEALEKDATRIAALEAENSALADDPARQADMSFNRLQIADAARTSLVEFGAGMSQDIAAQTRRLVAAAPWADPGRADSAAKESAALKKLAASVEAKSGAARQSIEQLRAAESAETALPLARKSIAAVGAYQAAIAQALKDNPRKPEPGSKTAAAETTVVGNSSIQSVSVPTIQATASGQSIAQLKAELDRVSDATEGQANEVIKLARVREPGSGASEDAKQAYRTLNSNANAARDYKRYLDRLKSSMRGAKTTAEAEQFLAQGRQTSQYVSSMVQSSRPSKAILDR